MIREEVDECLICWGEVNKCVDMDTYMTYLSTTL